METCTTPVTSLTPRQVFEAFPDEFIKYHGNFLKSVKKDYRKALQEKGYLLKNVQYRHYDRKTENLYLTFIEALYPLEGYQLLIDRVEFFLSSGDSPSV